MQKLLCFWRNNFHISSKLLYLTSSHDNPVPVDNRECSGSVVECLSLRLRGRGIEPHRRHCVVSLSKTH